MYENKTVAVVIPCYNEETQITQVIETMPDFVDTLIVVDDRSSDGTIATVKPLAATHARVHLIEHERNEGVGGAIERDQRPAHGLEQEEPDAVTGQATGH